MLLLTLWNTLIFIKWAKGRKGQKWPIIWHWPLSMCSHLCSEALLFFFFSFLKRLIVFIHHNSGQLHFPITEILKGVMNYYIKTYFTHKHIALITPLGIFVIEKCSNIELWWTKAIILQKREKKKKDPLSLHVSSCSEASIP